MAADASRRRTACTGTPTFFMRVAISDFLLLLYCRVFSACVCGRQKLHTLRCCWPQRTSTGGGGELTRTCRTRFLAFCFASTSNTAGRAPLGAARATADERLPLSHARRTTAAYMSSHMQSKNCVWFAGR